MRKADKQSKNEGGGKIFRPCIDGFSAGIPQIEGVGRELYQKQEGEIPNSDSAQIAQKQEKSPRSLNLIDELENEFNKPFKRL